MEANGIIIETIFGLGVVVAMASYFWWTIADLFKGNK